MSVAGIRTTLFNEYGGANIWSCECECVAQANGIGRGVVEHTQHILLHNHIVASHLGDKHISETDGIVSDSKLTANHVAVRGKAEYVVCLFERQLII